MLGPTGGGSGPIAGRLRAAGHLGADEPTVVCVTGNGLQTQEAVAPSLAAPPVIEPRLAELQRLLATPNPSRPHGESPMPTVRVPTSLRKLTQGQEEVSASGATIADLIDDLERQFPGLKGRICDDKGALRRFVNVFQNDQDIRFLQQLQTPIAEKDEISIVPAIAGGQDLPAR